MNTIGDRQFVEIPGEKKHELPPLLVQTRPELERLDQVLQMAEDIIDQEAIIPVAQAEPAPIVNLRERNRIDLAIQLVEQYLRLLREWHWGDGVLEWIRQCEITFENRQELRPLLRPDVWPHAGRSSFVTLLHDKHVSPAEVDLDRAVGLRLTFRQPPPLACFSDQFLFYLNSPVARTAYRAWADKAPQPVASLPPERFEFEVHSIAA